MNQLQKHSQKPSQIRIENSALRLDVGITNGLNTNTENSPSALHEEKLECTGEEDTKQYDENLQVQIRNLNEKESARSGSHTALMQANQSISGMGMDQTMKSFKTKEDYLNSSITGPMNQ